jgi:hypothetical protein
LHGKLEIAKQLWNGIQLHRPVFGTCSRWRRRKKER